MTSQGHKAVVYAVQ